MLVLLGKTEEWGRGLGAFSQEDIADQQQHWTCQMTSVLCNSMPRTSLIQALMRTNS